MPILKVVSPRVDHKIVLGHSLKFVACCCNVTVNRQLCDLRLTELDLEPLAQKCKWKVNNS